MPSYPYALTLVNPGAETGDTTGWTNVTGTLVSVTSGGSNTPVSGSRFFRAGASATTECYQDVAVPMDLESDIDAGLVRLTLAGWHGGAASDSDAGALGLQFLDGSAVNLGGDTRQIWETQGGSDDWEYRPLTAWIPPGTRTIRCRMFGKRTGGTNLDSYWDDLALEADMPVGSLFGDVLGLELHLRGEDLAGANGDPLDLWPDASGLANDVTGAGATRPTLADTGTQDLNDLPTAYGDGTQYLADPLRGLFQGKTGFTVFAVLQADYDTDVACIIGRDASGNRGWSLSFNSTTRRAQILVSINATTRAARESALAHLPGVPFLVRGRYDGANGELSLWLNGVQDDGTLDGAVPAAVGNLGPDLQVFSNGFGGFLSGHLAELLLYDRAIGDADCDAVEASLIEKYRLTRVAYLESSGDVEATQGVAIGEAYRWTNGTHTLYRWDADWALQNTNTAPFSGLDSSLDHMGDFAELDGILYVPVEDSDSPFAPHICTYDATTLARIGALDVSGDISGFETACLAINPGANRIYMGTFQTTTAWDTLQLFALDDLSYQGTLALSQEIPYMQGLAFNPADGFLYAHAGGDGTGDEKGTLYQIDPATGAVRRIYRVYLLGGSYPEPEGLAFRDGILYVAYGQSATEGFVRSFTLNAITEGGVGVLEGGGVLAAAGALTITGAASLAGGGRVASVGDAVSIGGPVVALTVLSYRRIAIHALSTTPDAVSYELYRSLTPGFTPGPASLIAAGLGPYFDFEDDAGLVEATAYYYVGVAVLVARYAGPEATATTAPELVFLTATETSGLLAHGAEAVAVDVDYQTALATDPTFSAPVDATTRTGSDRFSYPVAGLASATNYLSRTRSRPDSLAAWSAWSSAVAWATAAAVPTPFLSRGFTLPGFAEPVSGAAVALEWDTGGTVTAVDISDDLGASWSSLPGFTQTGVVFDSTTYIDGPYVVRVTTDDSCPFYHPGFFIDNADTVAFEDDFFTEPRPAIARYFSPTVPRWLPTVGVLKGSTGHIGEAPMATFGPTEPPELTAARGVCFMGEAVATGTGAGFSWDRTQAGELLDLGLVVLGSGDFPDGVPIGVRVGIKHFFLSPAYQSSLPDPLDPFRFVGVALADSHTLFEVGIGPVGVQPGGGWHQFQEPCTAGMSWTKMTTAVGGKSYTDRNRLRPYRFILWVTRPDPTGFPNRLHVRGHLDGPDAWQCNGRRQTLIDEVVDVLDGDGNPYVFGLGHIAFLSDKVPGNRAGDSGRFLTRWSAMLFEEVETPEPPPPDEPELIARACDLVLEVFEDDRETIKWSAGSAREHDTPYLVAPDRYAEQEIDVASGSATIGTVTVTVVDPAMTPGDQDSGWLTAKLAELGVADIQGRRARLNRFVNPPEGLVSMVIIDGVAGEPRLDESYAAFSFDIRDVRETERKVRLTFPETGATVLLPDGVIGGYGFDPVGVTYLIDPAEPLLGRFVADSVLHTNSGKVDLTATPGNASALRTIPVHSFSLMRGVLVQGQQHPGLVFDYRTSFDNLAIYWRAQGSSDPWTVIGATLVVDGRDTRSASIEFLSVGGFVPNFRIMGTVWFGDSREVPQIPAYNQDIEFYVVSRYPASDDHPLHIDGLTAGEFTKNVYDGLYSPRDEANQIVPTGIRYDTSALLAMTDPVRLRLFEPVTDARGWLEKFIYAPTGWCPALDQAGRISPVSQIPPESVEGLAVVDNAVTEPSSEWESGKRIVNVVRFQYYRDFRPADADVDTTGDGLAAVPIILEFRDEVSILRNGEQVLELDGTAFRAIGDDTGAALAAGAGAETGYLLAQDRNLYVLFRYSLGAPMMQVTVRRAPLLTMRAGDWVRVLLSWFPDYVTGKRGLVALCQVMAIADLDCAWRRVTLEQSGLDDFGSS